MIILIYLSHSALVMKLWLWSAFERNAIIHSQTQLWHKYTRDAFSCAYASNYA